MKYSLAELPAESPSPGVERRRLTGESLELIDYRYEPGSRFPTHSHPAEQLTIVLSGELVFLFEEEEIRLGAGESLLIPGGRPHSAYVPEDAGRTHTYNVFTPVPDKPPGG